MGTKSEQAMVGLFVLIAGAVLVATVFVLSGAFGGSASSFRAYFAFAGGLEPGATVRYAGGPKVGRVEKLQLDPKDSSRIEITFSVKSGLPVRSAVQHLNSASEKLEPLLQDLRKTSAQADETLSHVDSLIGENRADVRQAVVELRKSLTTITDLTGKLDQTLDVNSENIDELLENLRHVSQNLKEFTNTIKTRPYTLIRSNNPREHKPGER